MVKRRLDADQILDREEATSNVDLSYYEGDDDDDSNNDWSGEVEWTAQDEDEGPDGDLDDESQSYVEFLNQEVRF